MHEEIFGRTLVTSLVLAGLCLSPPVHAGNHDTPAEQARVYLKRQGDGWVRVTRAADRIVAVEPAGGQPNVPHDAAEFVGGLFSAYVSHPTGSWPEAVAIGDLNSDGRNDVALVTSFYFSPENDYSLFVFYQAQDGSLGAPVRHLIGGSPESVRIADMNDDGRDDVIVGRGDAISVLHQTPAGTLSTPVVSMTPRARKLGVGDFNSDGLWDVAGIAWGSNDANVDVFLQTATGLAKRQTILGAHAGYDDVEVGDLDDDGRDDLVVMSGQLYASPNLSVFFQRPIGLLNPPQFYDLGGNELTNGVGIGDRNDDGRDDAICSLGGNSPSAEVATWLQQPGGTLGAPTRVTSYDIPEPVEVVDVSVDGLADVVVAHGGWTRLGVYVQGQSGEDLYPIPYASHYEPHGLAVGDINSDGAADVAIADYNNGLVLLRHVPVVGAPGAPRRLTCRLQGRRLMLTWAPGGGAARYRIERADAPGNRFVEIGQTTGATRYVDKYADRKLGPQYRVTAVNPQGESASETTCASELRITSPRRARSAE